MEQPHAMMTDTPEHDGSKPLSNHRQELFCQYLSAGESKTQAYIKAGYKDTRYAQGNAQHLWERHAVKRRTTHLQDKITAKLEEKATIVTKETITNDIQATITDAKALNHTSAVVSALGLLAKIHGLVTDKVETRETTPEMTKAEEEERQRYAAWRLEQEALEARKSIKRIG